MFPWLPDFAFGRDIVEYALLQGNETDMTDVQTDMTPEEAGAALSWLIAMGADEIVSDHAVDRFATPAKSQVTEAKPKLAAAAVQAPKAPPVRLPAQGVPVSLAELQSIEQIEMALLALEDFALKRTASNLCFAGGALHGHTMVIGDVAGREEDVEGAVFAGQAAALLTRMLSAIGLSTTGENPRHAVSLFNLVPWRPPGQRPPTEQEVAQLLPYLMRAIEICEPRYILCFGGLSAQALLQRSESLMVLRGKWFELSVAGRGIPLITTFSPRMLLQQRAQKRLAWRDLLSLQEKMTQDG